MNTSLKMIKCISCLSLLFLFTCCDSQRSKKISALNDKATDLNATYAGKILWYDSSSYTFSSKANLLTENPTIIVYYDANCSVCFEQLQKWKEEIKYFKGINASIDFRFVLSAENIDQLKTNLEKGDFPLEYVVVDKKNRFVEQYNFVLDKAFNAILLNKQHKILMIGSPLVSGTIKKHFTRLLHES